MSMRTIARSSSKRKSASDLASSVLPVPVGPRKRNEPVGRFGSAMPARERRTASLTAFDRGPLADQPLADDVLHPEQLGGLALEQPAGGDAGPGLDDVGDLLGADLLADQRLEVGPLGRDGGLDLALQLGDRAVEDLAGRLAGCPRAVSRSASICSWSSARRSSPSPSSEVFSLSQRASSRAAPPPGRRGPARSLAEPLLRRVVGLLLERELLHLEPVDLAAELVDLLRRGLDLHPQPGRRLVDQVDRLVGQLAAGDVAVGQRRGGDQRGVGDADAVVRLVLLLDAAQDLDGVLDAGLADEDLLEPALQRGVLLDPLAVLVERGRADHVQLAAGQHRLEHVAGVHRGVAAGTGADDRVQLVDERDELAAGVLDLLEHGLEPLLELAAVLRPGHHRGQVEAEHPAALERVGHVAGDDPLGEPLDDGGLADAGLADQHRVVLGTPATAPAPPGGSRRRGRSPGRACRPRRPRSGRRSTSPAPRTSTPRPGW